MIIGEPFSRKLKLNTGSVLDLILQIQWQISTVKSKSLDDGTSWHARHCTCNPVNHCHGCNRATPHIYVLALLFCFLVLHDLSITTFSSSSCRTWQTDHSTGSMFVSSTSVEHAAVTVRGVRAQVFCSFFLIEPLGSKKSRVTHLCRTDTRCVSQIKSRTETKSEGTLEKKLQALNSCVGSKISFLLQSICSLQTSVGLQEYL